MYTALYMLVSLIGYYVLR